jgi:hypothetical protein
VNTTNDEKQIEMPGNHKGVLSGRSFDGGLVLAPLDAEVR